jgi:hypothetical protein
MLLQTIACKKRTPNAKELSIKLVGDSRMNHIEERGNDTIQSRSDSDFVVKSSTVQFYAFEHNWKSNH